MSHATTRFGTRGGRLFAACAGLTAFALLAGACGSDKASAPATSPSATTPATTAGTDDGGSTFVTTPSSQPPTTDLGPATGEKLRVGLVNTEGTPGLDFPDIRKDITAAVGYLNEHGGFGGRPIELVPCIVKGTPETSQSCAQELVGQKVDMVLIGLDLFPAYPTYNAAKLPIIGVLPILPGDYTADALFITGGNATVMSAVAQVAKDHFKAKSVAIISASNAGSAQSAAAAAASLKIAGIESTAVTGGDNETDAGFQALMRQAAQSNPDIIISLYADAGCIGTMRGRAALGITIPVITTGICSSKDVLSEVGDDALGWTFAGVQTSADTPARAIMQQVLAPVLNVPAAEIDQNGLGLGGLGYLTAMSLAEYANKLAGTGVAITAQSLYDYLKTSKDLKLFGGNAPIECGALPAYSAVCSYIFPFAEYQAGGKVVTIPGLEGVSSKALLP
ncbi:unannotated protein [freshwater metagenome]|uniref:Unannotated protein n=1 Tax=freshwater metagenome TaxID=449393 RepID=A0A6J7CLZ7_9ZZZZ